MNEEGGDELPFFEGNISMKYFNGEINRRW